MRAARSLAGSLVPRPPQVNATIQSVDIDPFVLPASKASVKQSQEYKTRETRKKKEAERIFRKPKARVFKNVPRAPAHPTPAQAMARDRESLEWEK